MKEKCIFLIQSFTNSICGLRLLERLLQKETNTAESLEKAVTCKKVCQLTPIKTKQIIYNQNICSSTTNKIVNIQKQCFIQKDNCTQKVSEEPLHCMWMVSSPFITVQRVRVVTDKYMNLIWCCWGVSSAESVQLRYWDDLSRSKRHHLGLFGFGFLHWNMHFFMVCTHVVGQPANCHRVS